MQIARYSGGRQEIVKHIGSAHTDIELGMLLERARAWLEPDQQALDLGITPQLPVENTLPAGQGTLLRAPLDEQQPVLDAPGRTETTASVLLREALHTAYDQLGFDRINDEVFRDPVIARIVEPGSKLDAGRVLRDLGATPASYATIKRHLRSVLDKDYRAVLAERCFAHAAESGGLSLLLYDVTVRREALAVRAEVRDLCLEPGRSQESMKLGAA